MKYIIDIPDFDKYNMPSPTKGRVVDIPIIIGDKTFNIPTEMAFIGPYTEPDRKQIEDEVWDFVRFMFQVMDSVDRFECFGSEGLGYASANSVVRDMTYQEAKAKYEAWRSRLVTINNKKYKIVKEGDGKCILEEI